MVWQHHATASTSGRVPQGALALAFFADAHWQKRFPPDETGEARKLRRWIAHRMDVCKWIGLALLLLQVRLVICLSIFWPLHGPAVSTQTPVCAPSVSTRSIQKPLHTLSC
jgi:hypothetical protein